MLEAIFSAVLPVLTEIFWTACAAMLAYAMNKLTNQFA